jgi:glycosyltransferase involved in cell wall biosynthesis
MNEVPTLSQLPDPPPEETGWPWTVQSEHLSETQPNGEPLPKISIVTPSYNQGQFIEETIRSVLLQGYPNLEYVVMDGGSDDETVEILEKYDPWIDCWVSEPDRGQSHAVNKGFKRCSGKLATFINSDDMLEPNALVHHMKNVGYAQNTIYVGRCRVINKKGDTIRRQTSRVRSFEDLVDVPDVWRGEDPHRGHIVQMEVLFPLDLYKEVGGLNEDMKYAMDFELWGRMLLNGAEIQHTGIEVGVFRWYDEQKTSNGRASTESLCAAAKRLIHEKDWSSGKKSSMIGKIKKYENKKWKETGRLAKLPIPKNIVTFMRKIKNELDYRKGKSNE